MTHDWATRPSEAATVRAPAERACATFVRAFGGHPQAVARAPGRVNLIGDHTDYNDGFCLPCAIDRETVVAARRRDDASVCVIAADESEQPHHFTLTPALQPVAGPRWANYVRGMFAALQRQGHTLRGADLVLAGNVPQGAGLSSSAALEMAVGVALRHLYDLPVDDFGLAQAGQSAEHDFAGCRCGIMDQLASAAARREHAMLLDCRSLAWRSVPLPADAAILVIDSRMQRGLVDSAYNLRRSQCAAAAAHFGVPALRDVSLARWHSESARMDPLLARRSRHVISENERILHAAAALAAGDLGTFGSLMAQSHASLRDDFEVSVPAIDALVALAAQAIGPRGGARMTGGGFGGCVVALLPSDRVAAVERAVSQGYRSPAGWPAALHRCRATAGAGLLTPVELPARSDGVQ